MKPLLHKGAVFRYDVGVAEQSDLGRAGDLAANHHQSLGSVGAGGAATPQGPLYIRNVMRTVQQQTHTHRYLISEYSPEAYNWEKV